MMGVSIVILAGGEGSRIGGDKGLQCLRGKPLIQWVLDAVRAQGDEILLSANGHGYDIFGCPVITDETPGMGPLGGLQAALRQANNGLVATVPCDTPFLPGDLVAHLHTALGEADAAVATAGGERQPAIAVYRRSVLPLLDNYLAAGGRRVGGWLETLHVNLIEFDDVVAFANINTLEELDAANRKR
jgi:molybdopterin-guanine dinucleotide biosynthesis protein A